MYYNTSIHVRGQSVHQLYPKWNRIVVWIGNPSLNLLVLFFIKASLLKFTSILLYKISSFPYIYIFIHVRKLNFYNVSLKKLIRLRKDRMYFQCSFNERFSNEIT